MQRLFPDCHIGLGKCLYDRFFRRLIHDNRLQGLSVRKYTAGHLDDTLCGSRNRGRSGRDHGRRESRDGVPGHGLNKETPPRGSSRAHDGLF